MPEDAKQKGLEEKAKEILGTNKLPDDVSSVKESQKPSTLINLFESRYFRILLTTILMFALFGTTYLVAYLSKKIRDSIPTNYKECSQLKSSTIQESYPAVCETKSGQKFVQEIPEEEIELLESDLQESEVRGISTSTIPSTAPILPTPSETTRLESEKESLKEVSEHQEIDEETYQLLEECMFVCQEEFDENLCDEVCKPVYNHP